jgi:lipopolysaccharide heptosyltransferase I
MKYRKLLIIKPSSLGDIVHSLPVLHAIKKKFPGTEIDWVVARGFEGLLEGHPLLRKLWIINKDEWKKIAKVGATVAEVRRLLRSLRAERFDAVIDLQGLFRSGFIAKGTGAPVRIGFSDAREGSTVFYTHTVRGGRGIHAVDRYLKIAAFLGCDVSEVQFPLPPHGSSSADLLPSPSFSCSEYAVMAPGARGATKRWPAQKFGELASVLPVRTVVIGSKGDAPLAGEVVEASKGKAISLAGRTDLKGLTGIVRCARFMVCNDTGPMHIAAALGVHVFALFGPTNPVETGPYGPAHTIITANLPCSPCYRRSCKTPECMDRIRVGEVAEAVKKKFSGR